MAILCHLARAAWRPRRRSLAQCDAVLVDGGQSAPAREFVAHSHLPPTWRRRATVCPPDQAAKEEQPGLAAVDNLASGSAARTAGTPANGHPVRGALCTR